MPFKSEAQRRFLYARHPEIAKRWRKEHGPQRDLPEKKGSSSPAKTRRRSAALEGLKKAKS